MLSIRDIEGALPITKLYQKRLVLSPIKPEPSWKIHISLLDGIKLFSYFNESRYCE